MVNIIETTVLELCADDPDYAEEKNFVGPNKPDSPFLHGFAFHLREHGFSTRPMLWEAYTRLYKYKDTQLPGYGISWEEVEACAKELKLKEEFKNRIHKAIPITVKDLHKLKWSEEEERVIKGKKWLVQSAKRPYGFDYVKSKEGFKETYYYDFMTGLIYKKIKCLHVPIKIDWEWFDTLEWSERVLIHKLKKYVQECRSDLPQEFWDFRNANKEEMYTRGYSVKSDGGYGNYYLTKWTDVEPDPPPVEVEPPADSDYGILYDHQKDHVYTIMKALLTHGVALDGSSTGTGKTFCGLYASKILGLRPIIICPKAVVPGWKKSLETLGIEEFTLANYELMKIGKRLHWRKAKKRKRNAAGVLVPYFVEEKADCEFITVKPNPKKGQWDSKWVVTWQLPENHVLIFDEAHRCKNKNTINTQLLTTAKDHGAKVLMLSATIASNPLKMFGAAKALNFYKEPWEFYSWARRHGCDNTGYNASWEYNGGEEEMIKLHHQIYGAGLGSRMDVAELIKLGKFPESQNYIEVYDFKNNQAEIEKIYNAVDKEIAKIEKIEKNIKMGHHLVHRQKDLQKVEILKIPVMVEMAEEFLEEGKSIVIFCNFTQTIDVFSKELNTRCIIDGRQNLRQNTKCKENFLENKERVILCNTAAAREGIDLHDKYHKFPRVSLIMPNDSAQVIKQCLGRVWRSGGSTAIQYIVCANNTRENDVMANVLTKIDQIDALNKGETMKNFETKQHHIKKPIALLPKKTTQTTLFPLGKLLGGGLNE